MRIECKKLRYLLEFFASLFNTDDITLLIKQLKRLQDNLGDFNDLYVQQEKLKDFLQNHVLQIKDSQQVAAAVGGLITGLYQRQIAVRAAFTQTFKEYSKKENIQLYQYLFDKKQS